MNNWKTLFPRAILTRGKFYYDAKNVCSLKCKNNTYEADVYGSDIYKVKIEFNGDNIQSMQCNCPYADSNPRCKHMAAVLYAINDKKIIEEQIKKAPSPKLFEPGETAGKYFDIEKLTRKWKISQNKFTLAKRLYLNRDAKKIHILEGYEGFFDTDGYTLTANYGDTDSDWHGPHLCFDKDRILNYSCDCSRKTFSYSQYYFNTDNEPCEHLIMLAWCIRDFILAYNPGDITDYNSSEFLKAFKRKTNSLKTSDSGAGKSIKLIPKLEYDHNELTLSFKTGTEKLYVVKKLPELVDCVNRKEKLTLGKSSELNFAFDKFDDESLKYYHLAEKLVREEDLRSARNPSVPFSRSYNKIHLMGSILDEFYDSFKDTSPELIIKSPYSKDTTATLEFSSDIPEFELTIEKNENPYTGEFEGLSVTGVLPKLLSGGKYHYFINENCLNRIATEKFENIKLLYTYSHYGNMNLKIGKKYLGEFCYNVLPALKEYASVDDSAIADDIDELIPPQPVFIFYLDAENSIPVCKPVVYYGDEKYTPGVTSGGGNDIRNFMLENEVVTTIENYFRIHDSSNICFWCIDDENAVFEILEKGVNAFLEVGQVHTTNAFDALKIRKKVKISIGVSIESDLMNLTVNATDISQDELIEILKSYRLKKKYHRLRNGNFVSLDESIEKLGILLDSFRIDDNMLLRENIMIPAFRALYLDKMLELCEDIESQRDKRFKKFVKDFKTVNESDFEVPESLSKIMRSYQHYGHKWLRTVSECGFGAILADDMGLGKTLQMISVLLAHKEEGAQNPSIIICPASLVYNWQEEFLKFAPVLSVCVISGNASERQELIENYNNYDVLITSYDLFKRDIVFYEDKPFEYQVLDEAQNIKNQSTITSKSVKILKSKKRFALTGTPIENRLSELWSIFDYLMPGYLYSYDTFKKTFETPIVKKQDKVATEKLKYMVSPFILRRLKTDVLKDLPDKIEEIRYARFDEKQKTVYNGQVAYMKDMLKAQSDDDFSKNKIRILAELTRIRQICCDPSLIFEDYKGESAKREACTDLIISAIQGNHKILVFSQFTSMFELLEKDFIDNGITYYKITGETDKKKRLELVKKFNSDSTNVFLISLKAGGTGLNLTGADVVIHYDPWWNVAAQNQATDRAHRIGQEKIVSVYKLIAKDTIEEKIIKMQEKKKELADAVISGNAGQFTSMSKDDIMDLLK